MLGGELAKGSINIDDILDNLHYVVDIDRASLLGNFVNKGFQGRIVEINNDNTKVAKMIKLRNGILDRDTKEVVYLHAFGSDIGVGPKIYGAPFMTEDSKYIVFIMDKVVPYKPTDEDNYLLIELFTKSFTHGLVPFDFEYAKDNDGNLLFLDFGVCGLYPSYKDAVKIAVDNDVFLYKDALQIHFANELKEYTPMIQDSSTDSSRKTKRKKRKNKRRKTKTRKTKTQKT